MKNILKYSVLGGLFLVPFIAFIVPTDMYFPFISGKGFAFRILAEILFGLYLLLALFEPQYRPKMSLITKATLVFVGAIFISDLLGANQYKSFWSNYERMEGFVLLAHLLLYYIVASSVFKTALEWRRFFNVSILASIIMSLYGGLQLLGKITINQGGVRLDGTFGNSSYLAIYLVFHIFLCLYILVHIDRKKWHKWFYGLTAVFEIFILYFTATRGAILGLIGGLILTAILLAWKEKENVKLRRIATVFLAGIVVFVLGFFALRNTSFVQQSPVLSRFANLSPSEFQSQGRYFVWPMAIKGILEKPVFGWGQENFNFVFNKYYDPGMYKQEQWFDRTHNIVLDWLIAGGIVGFVAYVSIYGAMFYYVWRKGSHLTITEKSIFTGMIAAYIFHNLFVFDNLLSYVLFFSLLGYVHSITVSRKEVSGKFHTKHLSKEVLQYGLTPLFLVLTIGMVYFVNVPALSANKTLIKAITPQKEGIDKNLTFFNEVYAYNSFGSTEATEQLLQVTQQINAGQFPSEVKKQFVDLSKEKIIEKINQSPHDARYLVFAGSFFDRIGQYDEGISYLERALVESPRKQSIYFELGTAYLGKRNVSKMLEVFKKAYDLEPTSTESKVIYAIGAVYAQDTEVLKKILPQIDENTLVFDDRVLKAYADIGDYNTAIAILSARVEKAPKNTQYKISLAAAYSTVGQKQKAIDIINQMIKDDPSFKAEGERYIKQIQG
jgi:O-antigen ligase/tetratricopeptide (TPR) repeat protein